MMNDSDAGRLFSRITFLRVVLLGFGLFLVWEYALQNESAMGDLSLRLSTQDVISSEGNAYKEKINWKKNPQAEFPGLYPPRRVVILAGPHKTESTFVQSCVTTWLQTHPAFNHWAWPLPSKEAMESANLKPLPGQAKGFAPLLNALQHSSRFASGHVDKDAVIKLHRQAMVEAWEEGKSLVFGAEAIDGIVDNTVNGTEIIEGLLDILPWSTQPASVVPPLQHKQIEVVVTLRIPRVKHLISIWHQFHQGRLFSQFILESDKLFILDSIHLALAFLDRGLKTTIIDFEGVTNAGIGHCQVIACDVLKVPCSTHEIELPEGIPTNSRSDQGGMDLSGDQLAKLDDILNEYDCGLRDTLLSHANLRFLFPRKLFEHCAPHHSPKPFSWLQDQIHHFLNNSSH